LRDHVALL
jgi:hypothetical protein